jgi:hypothetical protein
MMMAGNICRMGMAPKGGARLHRLDASVWRPDYSELTLFGAYGEVGRYFASLALQDRDPFATSNGERTSFGAILQPGSLGIEVRVYFVPRGLLDIVAFSNDLRSLTQNPTVECRANLRLEPAPQRAEGSVRDL